MQGLLHDFVVFLVSFVSHWQSYVTGGVVTGLIQVVERLTSKTLSKRAYFFVFVVSFSIVAFFMAWREQYERAERAQSDLQALKRNQQPSIQVNVPPPEVIINSSTDKQKNSGGEELKKRS